MLEKIVFIEYRVLGDAEKCWITFFHAVFPELGEEPLWEEENGRWGGVEMLNIENTSKSTETFIIWKREECIHYTLLKNCLDT